MKKVEEIMDMIYHFNIHQWKDETDKIRASIQAILDEKDKEISILESALKKL